MKHLNLLFIFLISVVLTSCTAYVEDGGESYDTSDTTQSVTSSITVEISVTESPTDTEEETNTETAVDSECSALGDPVVSIDLNYDGIAEDFFLGKDEFGDDIYIIVMDNGKDYHNNVQIPRTELIDVYKQDYSVFNEDYGQSDETPDYRYWFTYICGFGVNKCIESSPVYTGSEKDRSLNRLFGMGYYTDLVPYIKYDKKVGEKGFFELINDPHYFFKKYNYFEFVESISLEERINSDCRQTYLSSIAIFDEMPEIQIYSLENDLFGKKYKLTNGKYSYFTDEFDSIELFERYADVAVPTMRDETYDIITRNEKDYLICLKNSNEDVVVLLYLGTVSEGFLFQYGAEYELYKEKPEYTYKTYLEYDGWSFVKQIETENINKNPKRGTMAFYEYGELFDKSEFVYITLPHDKDNIEELKDCKVLDVTLTEKTDLSFLAEFKQLKGLSIFNGEEDPTAESSKESYVESYNFLKSLDSLELLRIGKEPDFGTEYVKDLSKLKYLLFSGTNVDFKGCFPNIEELSIVGGNLSSGDLWEFFPDLTGLAVVYNDVSFESVGKMEKLEILYLAKDRSLKGIENIAGNKKLRSFVLAAGVYEPEPVDNEEFLLELPDLEYFWCLEGVISDETVNKLLERNIKCEFFNYGIG